MERRRFITYKGHKILYIDHTGLKENEIVENMNHANKIMMECSDTKLLLIINFTDTFGTEKIMVKLKSPDSIAAMKKVKKTAVLGIVGIKKILLNAYNQFIKQNVRAFNTMEEAQEYLISE
ncbi:MAG: hypothetical protein JXB88_03385 [Spirochaetales bacterium]|nr:hypothetical protein [Spirochaetales bacterium]